MKVYVLIDSYEDYVKGVFTSEGKKVKDKERLEAAHILRVKAVESFCNESRKFKKVVDGLNKQITSAFTDVSPSPSDILNTITLRDTAAKKLANARDNADRLNQLSAEEVIREFGIDYWVAYELQGN